MKTKEGNHSLNKTLYIGLITLKHDTHMKSTVEQYHWLSLV